MNINGVQKHIYLSNFTIISNGVEEQYKKIIEAAQAGGQILKQYFGQILDIEEKSMPADFVTTADLQSEAAILNILKKEFPDYNIKSEEAGRIDKGSKNTFIIDPLDGSNNFVIGVPFFSANIALLKNNEIIFSVVSDPISNQTFYAIKGQGSFLDGKKISVNGINNINKATVSFSCPYKIKIGHYTDQFAKIYKTGAKRVLANWSPAMEFCFLANGKIEALVSEENEDFDFVAGKLIAREAGALITDFSGEREKDDLNSSFVMANSQPILDSLLAALK